MIQSKLVVATRSLASDEFPEAAVLRMVSEVNYHMELAAKYLTETSWPLVEIGYTLGYDYQSHFCTTFKRKYGILSTDFRAKER